MKRLLLFLFIACWCSAGAQEPAMFSINGYGGNYNDIVTTHVTPAQDGGFIATISSSSSSGTGNIDSFCSLGGFRNIFLKYNADASILEWSKCYGNEGDSFNLFYFPTPDGGNVIGGEFGSGLGYGLLIYKQNESGAVVWTKSYSKGTDAGLIDMIQTTDGGYILLGESYYTDTNFSIHHGSLMDGDICVLKVDSNGDKIWSKVIGGSYSDEPRSVALGPNGGCYILGITTSNDYDCTGLHGVPDSAADGYIVRLDASGNIIWHRDLGGSGRDGEYGSIISNGKGGALVALNVNSPDGDVSHFIGNENYWLLDIDSNNNILWDNCYGGIEGGQYPYALCKSSDGTIWINGEAGRRSGQVDTAYGYGDMWIVHTDSFGTLLNAKVLGGSRADAGNMIYPLADGRIMAGGDYSNNDDALSLLPSFSSYPAVDAFLCVLYPWATQVPMVISRDETVQIYPDPVTSFITIKSACLSDCLVTILNISGERYYSRVMHRNEPENIDVSGWAKGLYLVKMSFDDGMQDFKKLIVQ